MELNDINLKELIENETGQKFNRQGFVCCPFHGEKTGSMAIKFFPDANKERFTCFGCGEKGDAIDFIQKFHNKSYDEAREHLGLQVEKSKVEKDIDKIKNFIDWELGKYRTGKELLGVFSFEDESNVVRYYKAKFKDGEKKTLGYYHIENDKVIPKRGCNEIPYNLYRTLEGIKKQNVVIFVEGEKDANTLNSIFKGKKYVATSIKGVKDFSIFDNKCMNIYVCGDTGKAGDNYKREIFDLFGERSFEFRFINLPGLKSMGDNKDVTDWIEAGHNKYDLLNAFNRSLDIKCKYELQQDFRGVYKWFFDKKNDDWIKIYITDFQVLEAKRMLFVEDDIEGIKFVVKSITGDKIERIGQATVFDDSKSFKNFLGTMDLSFKGKIEDLTEFKSWINRFWAIDNEEVYQGIKFINKDGIQLITNEGAITVKGFDYTKKADKRNSIELIEKDRINRDELQEVKGRLFKFNSSDKTIPIIGTVIHNLAVLHNQEAKEKLHHLLIVGESGSGKSTILSNVVAAILNYPLKDIKSIGLITSFAFVRDLSNGNYPALYDEFKPSSLDRYKIQKLSESLRNLYDRTTISRGDKSFTTKDFRLTRPIILAGEESYPNSEKALIERSCIVYLSRRERTAEHTEAMKWLIENELLLNKMGRSLIDIVLRLNIDEYKEIRESVKSKFIGLKNRPLTTAVNIGTGIEILNLLLQDHGLNKLVGYEKYITNNIKEEILEGGEETKSTVEQMICLYNSMIEDGRAEFPEDVVINRGDGLFIRTSEMLNQIHNFVNKVGSAEVIPLKAKDFKKQAKKAGYLEGLSTKIIKVNNKNTRFDSYNAERMKELNIPAIIENDFTLVEDTKVIEGVF